MGFYSFIPKLCKGAMQIMSIKKMRGSKAFKLSKKLGLSTGVLVGALAVTGTLNPVQAESNQSVIEEVKSLEVQYKEAEKKAQEAEVNSEEQAEDESEAAAESEELRAIKAQVVQLIQRVGGQSLLDQLQVNELSVDELDNVFDAIITYQLNSNNTEETETIEEEQAETPEARVNETPAGEEQAEVQTSEEEAVEADPEAVQKEEVSETQALDSEESKNSAEASVEEQEQQKSQNEVDAPQEEAATENSDEVSEDTEAEGNNLEAASARTAVVSENDTQEAGTSEDNPVNEEENSEELEEDSEVQASEKTNDVNEEENSGEPTEEEPTLEENEESKTDEETVEDSEEENEEALEVSTKAATLEAETDEESADDETDTEEEAAEVQASEEPQEENSEDTEEVEASEETEEETEENSEDTEEVEASEESQEETEENSEDTETEEDAERVIVDHTVQSGETLNKISTDYETTVDSIVDLNDIQNKNIITVGQNLLVDTPKARAKEIEQREASEAQSAVTTTNSFINEIGPYASKVADEYNLYASVMISQAALESGYGSSQLSSPPNHNLFGIKGKYNGESASFQTKEYSNSTGWITITDHFKRYPSFEESFEDNAKLLRSGTSWDPEYYAGTWKENTNSYRDATDWLEGRYATDPTYSTKLNNIITTYDLTRYDSGPVTSVDPELPDDLDEDAQETPSTSTPSEQTHTVVYGDTLNKISNTYGTTVDEIKGENNLSSDLIVVGQVLTIPGQESTEDSSNSNDEADTSEFNGTYTIQSGDTLTKIANKFDTSVSALKSANGLTSDLIVTGNPLSIPGQSGSNGSNSGSSNESADFNGSYTIQSGDTLTKIANRFDTSVNALKSANGLTSDLIVTGSTLSIPGQSGSNGSNSGSSDESSDFNGSYTIQSGDTLTKIANRFGTSVSALKSANGLTSDLIVTGSTLSIPGQSGSNGSNSNGSSESADFNGSYTIQSGDTLTKIANRFNTSVSALKSANGLTSDLIVTGSTLSIPGQSGSNGSNSGSSDESADFSGTYTIQSGDTLTKIANRFDTSVSALKSANGLTSDLIVTGSTLSIPGQSGSTGSNSDSTNESADFSGSYTIQSGDTLTKIANRFGTSVSALKSANGLTSDLIVTGSTLSIPGQASSAPVTNLSNSNGSSESADFSGSYTIQSGDTLTKIANRFGTSVSALKSANGLTSDLIVTGNTLSIPGQDSSAPTTNLSNSNSSNNSSNNQISGEVPLTYTVKSGDTLSSISNRYNISMNKIMEWNNISNPDIITVGTQLNLRLNSGSSADSNSNTDSSSTSESVTPVSTSGSYTVKSGDTLSGISRAHGTTVSALKSANNLSGDTIYVGQTLTLSGEGSSNNSTSNSSSSNGSSSTSTSRYTVSSGDTLSGIAQRYNTSARAIANLNNLSSDLIYVGQSLQIPSSGSSSNQATPSSSTSVGLWPQLRSIGESVMGTPYQWGGESPVTGFDCSGFVQWVFAQAGVSVPRTTQTQYAAATKVSNPRPGDLVFFGNGSRPTHVGFYAGNGQFLGAQTSTGVAYATIHSGYWGQRFMGYGRLN